MLILYSHPRLLLETEALPGHNYVTISSPLLYDGMCSISPLTAVKTSTGLSHIAFPERQTRWTSVYFANTTVGSSNRNFLPLSCQKEPWGVKGQCSYPQPSSCWASDESFLISAYVWGTFNEAINSLIYATKYMPDYNNFQSLPIWSRFKPVVDFQKQFENQNQLSNQIFQLQTMSRFSSQRCNVYVCWLKIT